MNDNIQYYTNKINLNKFNLKIILNILENYYYIKR